MLGPLLAYEVMSAFFLEAGFLGILLFGWDRVGPRLHYLATCLVFVGTMLSAFWILSASSWMHTPAGYRVADGVFFPESWWAVVFNPSFSFPYRLAHMLNASFLTTAFVVAAVAAWYLRRGVFRKLARPTLRLALYTAALLAPLQVLLGDLHGLNTLEHQPTKVAAMEAHWEPERGAPLYLAAWPDMAAAENRWAVGIPHAASLILAHSWDGRVPGLKEVPRDERPYVPLVFWSFRVMIGLGLVMLALAWWGAWRGLRGRLEDSPRLLALLSWSAPLGFLAVLAGWITTEAGRQPWTVQGLMRTSESVSDVSGAQVAVSLALFVLVYTGLLAVYLWYFHRLVTGETEPTPGTGRGRAHGG